MKHRLRRVCRCGHLREKHAGSSGPWSNGRYHHGECVVGAKSFPPYRLGGCDCYEFRPLLFPRLVAS